MFAPMLDNRPRFPSYLKPLFQNESVYPLNENGLIYMKVNLCMKNSFSYQWFCTKIRFDTHAEGNSKMAHWVWIYGRKIFFCVLCQGPMTLPPTRSKDPNILHVECYRERLRMQLHAFQRCCLYNKLKGPKAIRMAGSEMTLQGKK